MLTTKLVVFLVGGGAVIGVVGTRVTSDVMGSHAEMTPCQVIYAPPEPAVKQERPVGVQEVFGNFSDLFKQPQQQGKQK